MGAGHREQGNPLGSGFFTWELKKKQTLVWSLLGQENVSSKGLRGMQTRKEAEGGQEGRRQNVPGPWPSIQLSVRLQWKPPEGLDKSGVRWFFTLKRDYFISSIQDSEVQRLGVRKSRNKVKIGTTMGFPCGSAVTNLPANSGDLG